MKKQAVKTATKLPRSSKEFSRLVSSHRFQQRHRIARRLPIGSEKEDKEEQETKNDSNQFDTPIRRAPTTPDYRLPFLSSSVSPTSQNVLATIHTMGENKEEHVCHQEQSDLDSLEYSQEFELESVFVTVVEDEVVGGVKKKEQRVEVQTKIQYVLGSSNSNDESF